MGMAAILIMWSGPFEQLFVPPTHGSYIWTLVTIGPTVSQEKSFETSSWADNIIFVIQEQVTLKWNIRSGPWSEILCLSWILASLKMLQSKLKALWAGQHFPHYKFYGKIFCRSRASNSAENNPTWPKFELVREFMPSWIPTSLKKLWSKLKVLWPGQHFPIISLQDLFVVMVTTVFNNLSQNYMQSIHYPSNATCKIWSRLARCFGSIFMFKCVDGRRTT